MKMYKELMTRHNELYEQDVDKLVSNYPDRVKHILYEWYMKDPHHAERCVRTALLDYHLDEEMMEEALETITRYDGVKAPFWPFEEIEKIIDTKHPQVEHRKYNGYDINFFANYLAADYESLGQDAERFVTMAIEAHEDVDDPHAEHKAYHVAKRRIHEHNHMSHNPGRYR